MQAHLLDTNTVSHLIRQQTRALAQLQDLPMHSVCLSAITAGELAYGLAKRPEAKALRRAVDELLARVDVLAWDQSVAQTYGRLRAQLQAAGTPLGALDMQIAAHALHVGAVLVTSDQAFAQVPGLTVVDWG